MFYSFHNSVQSTSRLVSSNGPSGRFFVQLSTQSEEMRDITSKKQELEQRVSPFSFDTRKCLRRLSLLF